MKNIFANGLYFKENPDNILAEQKESKSRYGKPITLYKGSLADLDRINATANLTAVNYDNPLVSSKTVDIIDLTDKDVEQIDNIENALSKSKSDVELKIKRDYKKLKQSTKPAESSMEGIETRSLQEVFNEINPEVSKEELQVFLWYSNQISKPVTNLEWFEIAGTTPSMLMSGNNNYQEKIKDWYEKGLVFYNGISKEIEPAWLYLSGDVYRKNARVIKDEADENTGEDIEYIVEKYGQKALKKQIEEIKKVFDLQYAKRLVIDSNSKDSLKILPNSSFAKNFFIKTLADETPFKWKQVSAGSDKRYGQMDFLDTKYYSDWKKTTYDQLNLRDAFCYWMVTDKSIQFKKGVSYADIINYYIFAKQKPKTSAEKDFDGRYTGENLKIKQKEDAAYERMKSKSKQEGDRLFAIFIDKMVLDSDKKNIENEWNKTFNNNVPINYNKIPVAFRMNKFIDGQPSDVRAEKREAVAFTMSNGSGLLAYDVGVGKTPSAIFTISAFIDLGWAKRPVVIVPNQTYKQWISEFKKFAGHIKINKLYNLNDSVIEDFQDTNGNTLLVDEGSVTIMTYEGMLNLGFNPETSNSMRSSIGAILMQDTSNLKSDKEAERQALKLNTEIEELLGKALRGTKINIEDLGLDYMCLDEAHACKKVFTSVRGESEQSTSKNEDKKGKATKATSQYKINSGTPSSTGIKGFTLCQYIQNNFQGNTQLLTATPFTNSPLEVFSMLAMVGYRRLEKMTLNNLTNFFDTFVDISYELVINAALNPERKQVILGFNNLLVLQQLVRQFINHKTGESVGVKRPNKYVLPYTKMKSEGIVVDLPENEKVNTVIPLTPLQYEYMAKIKDYAEGNISKDALCSSSNSSNGGEDEDEIKSEETVEIDEGAMDENEKKGVRLLLALNHSRNVAFSPYLFDCGQGLLKPTSKQFIETSGKLTFVMESIRSIKEHHEKTKTPMSGVVIYSERGVKFFPLIREYLIENLGFKPHEVGIISSDVKLPIEKGVSDEEAKEYVKNLFLGKRFNKKTLELEPLSDEERCKVLIGSATIREGINLQAYSSTLFNCFLSFNPTDIQQLEGRIYRQGNAFKNVRIVNPLMIDSADIFMFQKLEEKTSRINSIFDTDGQTNILKTEEFNPKELKYSLIKNPRVIAEMELMEDIETVSEEITDKKGDLEKLETFIEQTKNIEYRKDDLKGLLKDVRKKAVDKPLKDQITAIQGFWKTRADEEGRYVKQGSYDSVPKGMVQSPYSNVYKPYWFDDFNSAIRNTERFKRDFLDPRRVPEKDVADYIGRVKFEIEDLEKLKTSLTSDEAKDRKVMEVLEKREKLQIKEKSVDELVKDFARMNYLLDDVTLPKVIEPKVLMCPPVDPNGIVRIDSEGLMLLDECIKSQPQTKYLNSKEIKTEDGTVVYEYTEERKKLHKEIIDKLVGNALCTDQIEPIAIIMGGAPGSGKSTFLKNNAPYLQSDKIWKVDADEVRSMLPEYRGWNAPATHEEAKDVVNMLLDRYDTPCKHDLLYDGTMSNVKKYRPLIKRLKKLGYKVFLVFMNIPKEDSIKRALKRYQDNNAKNGEFGRYVPISVIEDFYGTGDEAFQMLKKEVDGYIKVDGIKQLIEERGGMQLPENRSYAGLGTNVAPKIETKPKEVIAPKAEPIEVVKVEEVIETAKPVNKVDFTEKRLKALKISLRFSKDKAMVEKRIKALEISLKVLGKKNENKEAIDKNQVTINKVEEIVKSKKGKYLTVEQYDKIKDIIYSNEDDLLHHEPETIPKDLRDLLEGAEMYYGFTENEIKRFLPSVNSLGYTFNYVDLATTDNGEMSHTVKPYALRKITDSGKKKDIEKVSTESKMDDLMSIMNSKVKNQGYSLKQLYDETIKLNGTQNGALIFSEFIKRKKDANDKAIMDEFNSTSFVENINPNKSIKNELPLGYKVVAFPGHEDFKYYVISEDDKNYVAVNQEKINHWKESNEIERYEYYEDLLPKSGVVVIEESSTPNKSIEYDWDVTFTSGPSKGQKLSEKVIDYIDVYDDFIYNLEFKGTPSSFQANTKETVGLLSITDNPVKLAVILDNDVYSNQKIIRRLQKLAENSGRIIVDNNDESRSERRSFPYLLVAPKDANKYTISEKFQGDLDTPRKARLNNLKEQLRTIASFVDEKNAITYKVLKSDKTPDRFEVVSSSPRWKEDIVEIFVSEDDAINHAKISAGIKKEEDPEKGFMNKTEARKPTFEESKLLKELHKLQRDLKSSRLSTYKEGDDSDESKALRRERESKLARFNEVLATLKELDSKKYGEGGGVDGGEVGKKGSVHIVDKGQPFNESRYPSVFDDFDNDGVVNIDDAYPNDPEKQGFVEKIRLEPIFKKLIDLKAKLNDVMLDTVEELKDKSPKTADIYARTKTPFSILKKLVDKRLLDESKGLTDLVGTTIAVDNYNDLVKVKNQIDAGLLGKVVDFDDFYAKPKAGYMAYHYIVKTDDGYSVEVQLKTKRMKNLNKVSHEFYKLGNLDSKNFLEVTQLTHNADLGNKTSISQYNMLMNNPDLLREIMTGKTDLKKAMEQKPNLFDKGGPVDYKKHENGVVVGFIPIDLEKGKSVNVHKVKFTSEDGDEEFHYELNLNEVHPKRYTKIYGLIRFESDNYYTVFNDDDGEYLEREFLTFEEAENWVLENIKSYAKYMYNNYGKKHFSKGGDVSDQEIFEQQFGKM